VLESLGIKEVLVGSRHIGVNNWRCINKNRASAVRKIFGEIRGYIEAHGSRYNTDCVSGELGKYVLGGQLEMELVGFGKTVLEERDVHGSTHSVVRDAIRRGK
jgi:hypothetical protein